MGVKFLSPKVNALGDTKITIYKDTNIYQIIKILQTTTRVRAPNNQILGENAPNNKIAE